MTGYAPDLKTGSTLHPSELSYILDETDFPWLGTKSRGKVRDSYDDEGTRRIQITTDRLSANDIPDITSVPYKGQSLNQTAAYWFDATRHVCPNHIDFILDPNVAVLHRCKMFPIEFIVRGFIAGSAWKAYNNGSFSDVWGITLPSGLEEFDELPHPIITPTTKGNDGAPDVPITREELFAHRIMTKLEYEEVAAYALNLYREGRSRCSELGLIVGDTKFEFGRRLSDGRIVVADEMLTFDCSRFWEAATFEERIRRGQKPDSLDKDPIRTFVNERSPDRKADICVTPEERLGFSKQYINCFERITGQPFVRTTRHPRQRIIEALQVFAPR